MGDGLLLLTRDRVRRCALVIGHRGLKDATRSTRRNAACLSGHKLEFRDARAVRAGRCRAAGVPGSLQAVYFNFLPVHCRIVVGVWKYAHLFRGDAYIGVSASGK